MIHVSVQSCEIVRHVENALADPNGLSRHGNKVFVSQNVQGSFKLLHRHTLGGEEGGGIVIPIPGQTSKAWPGIMTS